MDGCSPRKGTIAIPIRTRIPAGSPESTYVPGMDREHLRKVLETLQADEVEDVLTFVRVNEQAGQLSHEEADEWRRQIRARQTWFRLDD